MIMNEYGLKIRKRLFNTSGSSKQELGTNNSELTTHIGIQNRKQFLFGWSNAFNGSWLV